MLFSPRRPFFQRDASPLYTKRIATAKQRKQTPVFSVRGGFPQLDFRNSGVRFYHDTRREEECSSSKKSIGNWYELRTHFIPTTGVLLVSSLITLLAVAGERRCWWLASLVASLAIWLAVAGQPFGLLVVSLLVGEGQRPSRLAQQEAIAG